MTQQYSLCDVAGGFLCQPQVEVAVNLTLIDVSPVGTTGWSVCVCVGGGGDQGQGRHVEGGSVWYNQV
jgi:hypothetical protein